MGFSLNDLGGSSANVLAGTSGEVDLWSDADFEPYFISFSGGGSEFSQTIEKTNTKSETTNKELSANYGGGAGFNFNLGGGATGYATTKGMMFTQTETRTNTQSEENSLTFSYTLSDPESKDYFLIGVVPGRGMNDSIFLTYGGKVIVPTLQRGTSAILEMVPLSYQGAYNPSSTKFACETGKVTEPVWARQPATDVVYIESNGALWQARK